MAKIEQPISPLFFLRKKQKGLITFNEMDKEKEQIECKKEGCNLTGLWTEREDGKIIYCFRTRHRGELHAQKFTFAELIEMTGTPLEEIEVFLIEKQKKDSNS